MVISTAKELLEHHEGGPIYIYMRDILDAQCIKMKKFETDLKSNLPEGIEVSMHYSTKANASPVVLRTVKKHGLKVDCMSPGELYINRMCGFTTDEMLYVCNNITAHEMTRVLGEVYLMCFDSISQVETFGKMFPGRKIMVRINPGTAGVGHSKKVITAGKNTKFGICENSLPELFETAKKYDLRIIGVHQHLGSLFLNDKIPNYIEGVKRGLSIIKTYFKDVRIVDLGGGFGVPYKPGEEELDLSLVIKELTPILNDFIAEYPSVKEFKFEPGRYIPCQAGYLLGEVTAVKKQYTQWYIGTNIGMGTLVRPSMYGSYHEITLPETDNKRIIRANFCGNICESGDILGKRRKVMLPEVGDPVVVHNAGAYGLSMASNYTLRTRPAEVLVLPNGEPVTIKKAEDFNYMAIGLDWKKIREIC